MKEAVMTLRKILVPTDFSEGGQRALEYAVTLARPLEASLTLFHAYQFPSYGFPDGSIYITPPEVGARIVSEVADALARDKAFAEARGVAATVRSIEAHPVEGILEAARDHDLIVMGTHGRTGIKHLLLGSVAEKVVRHASCPVLTVRAASSASGA
jgi:nucleotide-binding universal stress UspA family protein